MPSGEKRGDPSSNGTLRAVLWRASGDVLHDDRMRWIATVAVLCGLLNACDGDEEPSPTAPAAQVGGQFRQVGGPAPGLDEPLAGRIDAHRDTRDGPIAATADSAADGNFRMTLPPGPYVFVGSTPRVQGAACLGTATLHEGENPPVLVTCTLR